MLTMVIILIILHSQSHSHGHPHHPVVVVVVVVVAGVVCLETHTHLAGPASGCTSQSPPQLGHSEQEAAQCPPQFTPGVIEDDCSGHQNQKRVYVYV